MLSTTIGSRMTSFIPLSSRSAEPRRWEQRRVAHQVPQQHRIGRGQRGAQDRRGGGLEVEQEPRGERDERGGKQGAGPEDEERRAGAAGGSR